MKSLFVSLALASLALAQDRCDAPYPETYCNTTEIMAYKTDDCRPYHVFIARGSDEPYPGRLGNLTRQVCEKLGGEEKCGFANIEYPAKSTAWGDEEWCKSAHKGASNGQQQLKDHVDKCPDAKLILVGLSQGASVVQDILGGGGGDVFKCHQDDNPALDADSAPGKNIVAAATFGAVARSRNQQYTVGAGKPYDGQRARTSQQLKSLDAYADRLLDYCHFSDPICAVGSTPENVTEHLNYFIEHNDKAGAWLVDTAKGAKKVSRPDAESPSSASSKPTASASGSETSSPASVRVVAATKTPDPMGPSAPAESKQSDSSAAAQTGVVFFSPFVTVFVSGVLPFALWWL